MNRPSTILRLRGTHGPVAARVHVPMDGERSRLVIAFAAESHAAELSTRLGTVVVQMNPASSIDVLPVIEWLAAHHSELGARGEAIAVTGTGDGAMTARAVAAVAARAGWPPLHLLDVSDVVRPETPNVRNT